MALKNDKYMNYELDYHLYIPTQELFIDKLNVNLENQLGGRTEMINYLEDMAFFIKDFILFYSNPIDKIESRNKVEYLIYRNNNDERIAWQRACIEFVRYALNDDGDMTGLQTGLSVNNGQTVDLTKLRGQVELSSRLHRVLYNSNLLYGGQRNWTIPSTVQRGVDY